MKINDRTFANPCRGNTSGLTLIEVLAAMIMLSLGLLTLLPMATLSMDANDNARSTDDVMALIQNRIEQMRNTEVITAGAEIDSVTGMHCQWWPEPQANDMVKVVVEVTWESETGVPHIQRGVTYVYRDK